ncbi:MAG: ABC transporter permease [Myxococcales bacterium]|nr:ABC transporter permease [Myxococcales bacterium]
MAELDQAFHMFSITFSLFCVHAIRSLVRNKLRSVLAAIAIMIGIGAVVCVVAIGRAGSKRAEDALQSLGDNFVWIEAGSRAPSGVRTGSHGTTSLTVEDAQAIARDVPLIKRVTPNVDGRAQVVYGNRNWNTHWRGINQEYFDIRHWPVGRGAPFLEDDVAHVRSIVLLGQTVRQKLFGDEDPIGKVVRINEQLFTVTGVLAIKGQSAMGQDQDDTVILPWTTAQRKLRGKNQYWLDDILCSAAAPEALNPAIADVISLLRQRHHIRPGAEDDFNVRRPDEIIEAQIETSHTLETLLISIAAIALVVGGIGVMNVMLVSVTERTREIGVRLAVGATEKAVQLQFLGEAVMLTLFGGVFGVLLGGAGCFAIARILGWSVSVPPDALVIAPLCSIAVGLFFGFYPARVAARLDPIEALRHE